MTGLFISAEETAKRQCRIINMYEVNLLEIQRRLKELGLLEEFKDVLTIFSLEDD